MCRRKIYYNTYADGAQDVTEKTYPCHEGRICHHPEIREYDRTVPATKSQALGSDFHIDLAVSRKHLPFYPTQLPTPRRSKSPSPAYRREASVQTPDASPKPAKHSSYRDRSDLHRSSRHLDADLLLPPKLKRSSTTPHFVVIEQGQPRHKSHEVPIGPVHVAEEAPGHRKRNSREIKGSNAVHVHRHSNSTQQAYVVDDERERRRHHRRRHSVSVIPEAPAAPAPEKLYAGDALRPGLTRRPTVTAASAPTSRAGSGTGLATSPPKPKHLQWEDEVRVQRDRHNAEIANRPMPTEVHQHQQPPLKGILKNTTTGGDASKATSKTAASELQELKRAIEKMDIPRSRPVDVDAYDLYDRERLMARFGTEAETDRERRRRSKVWVAGDRYQYH